MKQRVMSVVLALALLAVSAFSAAAEVPQEKAQGNGTILIEDVPGGLVLAEVWINGEEGMQSLPIGEEIELPAGAQVYVSGQSTYCLDSEHRRIDTRCDTIVASSSNAIKTIENTSGWGANGSIVVEADTKTVVTGNFIEYRDPWLWSTEIEDYISISLEKNSLASAESGGENAVRDLMLFSGGMGMTLETKDASLELQEAVLRQDGYSKQTDVKEQFAYRDGAVVWEQALEPGLYEFTFDVLYDGVHYTSMTSFRVGYTVFMTLPLGISEVDEGYYNVLGPNICSFDLGGEATFGEAMDKYDAYEHDRKRTLRGHDLDGWLYMNDEGQLVKAERDQKIAEVLENQPVGIQYLYASYDNFTPVEVKPLEQLKRENLMTSKAVEDAISGLSDTVDTGNTREKREFEAQVDSIVKGMQDGVSVSSGQVEDLDGKLEAVFDVSAATSDEITSAAGLYAAVGLTTFAAAVRAERVVVYLEDGVTVPDDAGAEASFTVCVGVAERTAEQPGFMTMRMPVSESAGLPILYGEVIERETLHPVEEINTPITLTIELPEEAAAAIDEETDRVKGNGQELVFTKEGNTITFTTPVIGAFTVGEKKSADTGDSGSGDTGDSGSGGLGGSSSSGSVRETVTDGWIQNETGWWYSYSNGTWPANGWAQLEYNGRTDWYYFNADGYMVTGWIEDGGQWYYLSPISDGYMGHMVTGWLADGDLWYYLSTVTDDAPLGHMVTGWAEVGGVWYYLSDVSDGTRGHMLAGTVTPDGYQVDEDGAWIQ